MVVAATGFFDGVHKGHRVVLDKICAIAEAQGDTSAVITLWPHPRTVLQQDAAKFRLLTSLEEKVALLKNYGINEVHCRLIKSLPLKPLRSTLKSILLRSLM
jgi:riboflavin kinase/FMN adenylyltransferase